MTTDPSTTRAAEIRARLDATTAAPTRDTLRGHAEVTNARLALEQHAPADLRWALERIAELEQQLDEPSRPRLTGWPQVVDLMGDAMRIVQMETGSVDETLCLACGTHEHRRTVTLKLVDEPTYIESRTR